VTDVLAQVRRDWVRGTEGVIKAHAQVNVNVLPALIEALKAAGHELGLMPPPLPWHRRARIALAHRLVTLRERVRVLRYGRGTQAAEPAQPPETAQGDRTAVSGSILLPTPADVERVAGERADTAGVDYGTRLLERARRAGTAGRPGPKA
jgi:hypothetical protein